MNEQLVVKNFGPITDATVDFKRVTVFIGPTGGGKSTLAKLMTVLKQSEIIRNGRIDTNELFRKYSINNFASDNTYYAWKNSAGHEFLFDKQDQEKTDDISEQQIATIVDIISKGIDGELEDIIDDSLSESVKLLDGHGFTVDEISKFVSSTKEQALKNLALGLLRKQIFPEKSNYFPAERVFVAALQYSWAGLIRDDIGLPKNILDFANRFSVSKRDVTELNISFLNVKYVHRDGEDFIKIPESETLFRLYETASGIQSVTPLLVLLEHLSRNTEQAQSFIIEEPELNLYPTAQQGLLNWLVEKCTKGENDLTITTHSPYILSSCNLLLEAYKVAQQRPDLEAEIAAIVPKACWLNPDEFAAYYVADGTVKPITDERTHLIGGNELDSVSGDISDSFRKLLRLKKQVA